MNIPRRYESLQDFIALLEQHGELHRVRTTVSADQEIAALTDRVAKRKGGGPGLLFEQVDNYNWSSATNLFGSLQRCAWAAGVERLAELSKRFEFDLRGCAGKTAAQRLERLVSVSGLQPFIVNAPPCREVVAAHIDLTTIPLLRNFPDDGGSYLTLAQVFTDSPVTRRNNCGIYRVQLVDPTHLAIHWHDGSDGANNFRAYSDSGKKMPIAIALGGDPALLFSAAMKLPETVDETVFASYLRAAPLEMTPCLSHNLIVPASAEVVLEGEVVTGEGVIEGPYGNYTGSYQPEQRCPLIHITHLSHRHRPIIPATIIGRPPTENCYLGKVIERLILPLLRIDHPALHDLCMPLEAIFHGCALVSIKATSSVSAQSLARDILDGPWLRGARLLVVFDQEVNVHDPSMCFWQAINHLGINDDNEKIGAARIFDATRKATDGVPCRRSAAIEQLVTRRLEEYGLRETME